MPDAANWVGVASTIARIPDSSSQLGCALRACNKWNVESVNSVDVKLVKFEGSGTAQT